MLSSVNMLSVTNLVAISPHGLLHHTTAAHHSTSDYNSHHSLHLRHTHSHPPLHQSHSCHQSLISPDCLTTPAPHSHTHTYKQHTSMHSPRSLVFSPVWHFQAVSLSVVPCVYLDCLYNSDRLLPAFWPCLPFDILSVCRLPRPLHCPCCWFCLAFVTPVTISEPCLFDLLFINKAAFGSNYTASSLHYPIEASWDAPLSYFKELFWGVRLLNRELYNAFWASWY